MNKLKLSKLCAAVDIYYKKAIALTPEDPSVLNQAINPSVDLKRK